MAKVLVTGSSKGIGRSIAAELSRRGHEVVATARHPQALAGLDVAHRVQLDVTDPVSVTRAAEAVGPVDALVNNAGDIVVGPLESTPLDDVRRLYDLNVFGALRVVQAFAPAMRARRGGAIVNVSSLLGRVSFPLVGAYSSTKWALEALSESLRFELAHFGVRVMLVEPGAVSSGALDDPRRHSHPEYADLAARVRFSPERMATPEDVARTVADALESDGTKFRWPVGTEAEALLGARKQLDDAQFEKTFRQHIAPAW